LEEKATAPGSAGPAGRDGVGASGIRFSAPAESSPAPVTALNTGGLRFTVDCKQSGSTVGLEISAHSDEDATFYESASIDNGTDPNTFAPSTPINGQIALAANTDTPLGGPTADPPQYFRVVASIIYVTSSRTMSLSIVALVDAASGRCSFDGTVTPTS